MTATGSQEAIPAAIDALAKCVTDARDPAVYGRGFPLLAKRNGASLVMINREPTAFDDIAALVVRDDIGTVLAHAIPGE